MSGIWLVSYLVLWGLVLLQGLLIFALIRELGVKRLRSAEGIANDGIAVGATAPVLVGVDRNGARKEFGKIPRPLLLIFGSRHCDPCRQLAKSLDRFARDHAAVLDVVFVVRDVAAGVALTADELALTVPVVGSEDGGDAFKTRVTPFAFLLDQNRTVRAKGLVNDRRGLNGLVRIAGVGHDASRALSGVASVAIQEIR